MTPNSCAAALVLALLGTLPAAAQDAAPQSSDRYRRDQPPAADQQAQSPDRRDKGKVETLRRDHMSSPNVQGERVPEDPATGVPHPEQGTQPRTEGPAGRP